MKETKMQTSTITQGYVSDNSQLTFQITGKQYALVYPHIAMHYERSISIYCQIYLFELLFVSIFQVNP